MLNCFSLQQNRKNNTCKHSNRAVILSIWNPILTNSVQSASMSSFTRNWQRQPSNVMVDLCDFADIDANFYKRLRL